MSKAEWTLRVSNALSFCSGISARPEKSRRVDSGVVLLPRDVASNGVCLCASEPVGLPVLRVEELSIGKRGGRQSLKAEARKMLEE